MPPSVIANPTQHLEAILRARSLKNSFLWLEFIITIAIIMALIGLSINNYTMAIAKARLSEILSIYFDERMSIIEDIALRGSASESTAANRKMVDDGVITMEMIERIKGIGARRRKSEEGKSDNENVYTGNSNPPGFHTWSVSTETLDSLAKFEISRDGFNIIARGIVKTGGSEAEAFVLPFSPAVIAEGPIGNVIWLCGKRSPPADWKRLAPAVMTFMPQGLLFSVCRDI